MHVVIFEGSDWKTFAPIALSRPVFTLATGASTLLEKQLRHLSPTRLTLWVRPELEEHCRQRILPRMQVPTAVNQPLDEQPALLVSGRSLHFTRYEYPKEPGAAVNADGSLRSAFVVRSPGLSHSDAMQHTDAWRRVLDLPKMPPQARHATHLWDLIGWNQESLIEDAARLTEPATRKPAGPYHLINENDVHIAPDVKLGPGCVLDATKGPVVVADHVNIGANSVIEGPCYLGSHVVVRPLTLIRPGTSVGTLSKVGGEISNSIILGWSNKAHDGFLGDSYVGKWVNLGAGTTTSNLKNTYGEVSMELGGRTIATGRKFLGSLIGDHSKTAILTRLMTGSYIGFCCMLAGSGLPPRFVPSFTFWSDKGAEAYRMDRAVEVTKRVFARRDRQWTAFDQRMMQYVSDLAPSVERG